MLVREVPMSGIETPRAPVGTRVRCTRQPGRRLLARLCAAALAGALHAQAGPQAASVDPLDALARLPLATATAGSVKLTIVDADKRPVPDAMVVLAPQSTASPLRPSAPHVLAASDPIRLLAASLPAGGVRYALDESGSARIPANFQGTILAIAGDRAGITTRLKDAPRTPQTLSLVRVHWVDAHVTQHDGAPAAFVTLAVEDPRDLYAKVQVATGADGKARVPVLALEPNLMPSFEVRALVPLKVPAARSVLTQPLEHPTDPIPLALPKCSSLRVRWTGLPAGAIPHIRLQPPTPTNRLGIATPLLSLMRGGRTLGLPQKCTAEGAEFAYVEAGVALEAAVTLDGMAGVLQFAVPTIDADKATEWTIDFAKGPPRIRVRCLDAKDKPLADTEMVAMVQGGSSRGRYDVRTDREGYVDLAPTIDPATDMQLRFAHYAAGLQSEILAAGSVPLAAVQPGGNDLGIVRMEPEPVALAGRFLDPKANPVAGVRISVVHQTTVYYSSLSGSDGAFTLRLPEPHPAAMRVSLQRDSNCYFADAPGQTYVELPGRRTDATITVERSGRLLVGLVPPIAAKLRGIGLTGTDLDHAEITFQKELPSDATMIDLPAGRWKIVLTHYQRPVATLDEVTIDPGVENHDARMMAIQWHEFARLVTLRLEAPDGNPTSECSSIAYADKPQIGAVGIPVAGKVTFLLPKTNNQVVIRPRDPSLRTVELNNLDSDRTVRFAPALRCDLSWQEALKLPAKTELVAMVMASSAGRRILTFDATDKATLFVDEPGKVELHLGFRANGRVTYLDDAMEVDVGPEGGARVLKLPPTVRAAIDGLPK